MHITANLMLSSTGARTGFACYFHKSCWHFRLGYKDTFLSAPFLSIDISKDINRTIVWIENSLGAGMI